MAIINSYPLATPKLTDLVLGTSTSSTGQTSTKSFTVESIKDTTAGVKTIVSSTLDTLTISGSGTSAVTIGTLTAAVTDGGVALTTGNDVYDFVVGKITGTADTVPIWTGAGPSTTLGNSLISQANSGVIISGNSSAQTDGKLTLNCWNGNHGVTIQAPSHSVSATYTLILPTVSNPGAGKVLTSGAGTTNQLSWTDNGNVGGTGTQNKLPKWTDTTTLGDSIMTEATDTISIAGNLSLQEIEVNETFKDGAGLVGGAGQLLSSTGTATSWVTPAPTGVTSFSTTNTNLITITPGTTPHTGAVVATPNISGGVSSSSQTLATGAEIQSAIDTALAGAVTFKGTFNASTGQITGGSNYLYNPGANSNTIAVAVGDMYVVSVAGNFFGNASKALNVGDEVIAVTESTIGPSDSLESYYNAVPSAGGGVTDVSSANTAITVSPSTGSVVLTSTVFSGGSTIGHVPSAAAASAGQYLNYQGNWTTLPAGDTYTLQAGTKAGTSVPLQLDAAAGTDSVVNLTEGSGITLTQTSATEITIEAASSTTTRVVNRSTPTDATTGTHDCGTVNQTDVNYIDVYVSGVYQNKNTYVASYDAGTGKTTITLTGGAFYPNGATIESITT